MSLPFIELFTPLSQAARQQLETHLKPADWLPPTAYQTLEQTLLTQLSQLAAPTLQIHFAAFRATHQALGSKESNNAIYLAFIQAMQQGRFAKLLSDYSVLNRLMATTLEMWVTTTAEFLHRLAADQTALAETFHQATLGPVIALQSGLSDPHHGGRTVWAATFASGLQLIYKPRSLALEQFYYDLITYLGHKLPLNLQPLPLLARHDYGWVKCALPQPCHDEVGIKRYYQRVGMVLALFYLLQGTDGHQENLMAVGEQPILLDLETLFHPVTAWAAAANTNPYSVLDTGLLPRRPLPPFTLETSGLGGQSEQPIPWPQPTWQAINTDHMELIKQNITLSPAHNLPMYQGQPQPAPRYLAEIEHGFATMYRFWQQHQPDLNGWVTHRAPQLPVRFLARATELYSALLRQSLHPKYLHDEATWRANFGWLTRQAHLLPPAVRPIIAAEQHALEQLDFPYFTVRGADLDADNGVIIRNCFAPTGFEAVMQRLNNLTEANLQQQLNLIRQTLAETTTTN